MKLVLAAGCTFLSSVTYSWADLSYGFAGRLSGAVGLLLLALSTTNHALTTLAVLGPLLSYGVHNGDLIPAVIAACICSWTAISSLSPKESLRDVNPEMTEAEQRIRAFMYAHKPSKLHEVDRWLKKYKGKEDVLFDSLVAKYGRHDDQGELHDVSGDHAHDSNNNESVNHDDNQHQVENRHEVRSENTPAAPQLRWGSGFSSSLSSSVQDSEPGNLMQFQAPTPIQYPTPDTFAHRSTQPSATQNPISNVLSAARVAATAEHAAQVQRRVSELKTNSRTRYGL